MCEVNGNIESLMELIL